MPQLQVLSNTEDPFVENMRNFGKDITDTILKKQAMELTKRELAIKSRATDNEVDAEKSKKLGQLVDGLKAIQEGTMKGPLGAVALKRLMEANNVGFDAIAEAGELITRNYNDLMKAQGPAEGEATEGQGRAALAMRNKAEAGYVNTMNKMYGGEGAPGDVLGSDLGGVDAGTEGATGMPSGVPMPGAIAVGQGARANALKQNAMTLMGFSGRNPSVTNMPAEAELAGMKTAATKAAERIARLAPVRKVFDSYIDQMGRAFKEMGGASGSGAEASLRGGTAKLFSEIGTLPEVQAFKKLQKGTALSLASYVNEGRPDRIDAASIELMLPDISYPAATNAALKRNLDALLSDPNAAPVTIGEDTKKRLIDPANEFTRRAKAAGAAPEQIELKLQQYYATQGY